MSDTTRIAVIGDSVAWGQGLLDEHKFSRLVAAKFGTPAQVELSVAAHSGAVIESGAKAGAIGASSEVPEAAPTIIDQVDSILHPDTVDLVILNGGINDVGLDVIFNPLTAQADLHEATVSACYKSMKALIDKATAAFSKNTCRFIVCGYYPILSPDSDPLATSEAALIHLLGIFNNGIPASFSLAEQGPIIDTLVDLAMQFWRDSDEALAQAVSDSASKPKLGGRLLFVPNTFTEANALFSTTPLLFGFGSDLAPEDEVIPARTGACNVQYSPLEIVAREICYHASVGHPNPAGASAIAQAIQQALGLP